MAWVEMVLRFIADIVHYAAWPAVVIGALYLFREPLRLKIRTLKTFGHKETTFDFADIPEAQKKMLESGDVFNVTEDTINYDWYLNLAEGLALFIGMLALDLQKHNKQSELLPPAKIILKTLSVKIKTDRPEAESLDHINKLEKAIESPL